MANLLNTSYREIFHDLADRRTDHLFLTGSPWYPVVLSVFYMCFVMAWGPRFMKNRPAMKVDRVIAVYNVIQVVVNLDLFLKALRLKWGVRYRLFCEPVEYSDHPEALMVMLGIWQYYLLKVLDLMDTVFFVLRKKGGQVTFLHVYHHVVLLFTSWMTARYFPGGHVAMVGTLNSIVHVVMYAYYFVSNMWPEQKKNIWWKKHITQMQMVQFVMGLCHSLPTFFLSDCDYPTSLRVLVTMNAIIMFVLFYNFYRHAYGKKNKPL